MKRTWDSFPVHYQDEFVLVADIINWLPRSRDGREYPRSSTPPPRATWHQKLGRATLPGPYGAQATAGWCIGGLAWPGHPYHLDIPYCTETTPAGQMVVYLCQPLDSHPYSAKGWNNSLAVALQGTFLTRHDSTVRPYPGQPTPCPSPGQVVASWAVWRWLSTTYGWGRDRCTGHHQAPTPKPTCPGDFMEAWIDRVRKGEIDG